MNLSFSNLTEAQWSQIVTMLGAKGLTLTGDSGTVEKFGARVTYAFGDGNLAIGVISPPHFHNLTNFTAEIRQFIQQAIA